MQALTLRFEPHVIPDFRRLLREIAFLLPPRFPGLRARFWRAARRGDVYGRYIFDKRSQAEDFACQQERDPAVQRLAASLSAKPAQISKTIEEIGRTDCFDGPIFIISAPRAGSTLLYEVLAQSRQLWSINAESEGVIEGIPKLNLASRGFDSHRLTDLDADLQTIELVRAGFLAELRDCVGHRYLEMPRDLRPSGVRLLEKTPENSLRIPFINAIFPSARFVLLHRDVRQNVSSILEAWHHHGFSNIPDLPGWPLQHWNFLLPEGWRSLSGSSLLEVAAFQWNAANQRALDDLEAIDRQRWISVDYTELVVSPRAVVSRILDFAGIAVDEHLSAFLNRPLLVSSTTISPPSPIKWRSNPEFRESAVAKYTLTSARLRDLGKQSAPPPPPLQSNAPVRYSCFLDELSGDRTFCAADWIVNPSFHLQLGPSVPLDLVQRTQNRERFLPDHPLLWVEDSGTRAWLPFWVRRKDAYLFRRFAASYPPPSVLPELASQLIEAGVLTTTTRYRERHDAFNTLLARARLQFVENGYCELVGLLHTAHATALNRYYESLIQCGRWKLGDAQVPFRHGWHNEFVSRYFHHQFTDAVSRAAGEPVRPSYTYVSAYRPGAVLKPHVDRKQCVFTLSILIEPVSATRTERWPLWFQTDRGNISVTQASGDGVLFRGCDLPHWRDLPPEGCASPTIIFHYVPRDFVGVLD